MGKEWQQRLAGLWWGLKLSAALIAASLCIGAEVILFFSLQEAWKEWLSGKVQVWELVRFALLFLLMHTPSLGGVLWFSRRVQRLWDGVDRTKGG